ncbi:ATP-binding cassette domain-containing protein [Domibacillus robiginosus]|uniref:ABC transporter ATP-binding protein n=1 Tax=Domibacillus robiginosus TaxID=1071054 RepID=UPI00067C28D8|nr:ATP-binding cassette domain-containing protein [Domibacillus robiginosus]
MHSLMELQNITKQFKGKQVIQEASLSILANQIVALIGKNGCGKSTLLKIIGGLARPDSGRIIKHKQPLKIGYVPEVTPSSIPFTPEQYLLHMGTISGISKQQLLDRIDLLLDLFQLDDVRQMKINSFSKGMKQKVTIMQAVLLETDVLLLDEPLSGLDLKAQKDVEEVLVTLKKKGVSVVLTCHETNLLEQATDKVLLIKDGEVKETNFLQNTENYKNRLVFEVSAQVLTEVLLKYIMIQQKTPLEEDLYKIEAIVHQEYTDHVLKELLYNDASIKQLVPISRSQEAFYQQF